MHATFTVQRRSSRLAPVCRVAALAGVAAVLMLALPGCVVGGDVDYRVSEHAVSTTKPLASKGKLAAQSRNGSLIVHKAKDGQLRVDATVKSRSEGRAKDASVQIEESAARGVEISIAWPDKQWHEGDGADIEIWIPEAIGLDLTTSNGEIEATGFSGKCTATTSNSDVQISDHAGDLIAKTSNGDIVVTRLTGSADAVTSNSGITIHDVSGPVTATTSNGDIAVSLASGASGPVNARTSNSSITLTVGAAFTGSVSAATSNGHVECLASRASRSTANTSSATFNFGAGTTSSLVTSNGNVTVKSK